MKLREIAAKIQAHLNRFAADPKTATTQNTAGPRLTLFMLPRAWTAGSRVGIRCVAGRPNVFMAKPAATAYLEWLDAGNVGDPDTWERAAAVAQHDAFVRGMFDAIDGEERGK